VQRSAVLRGAWLCGMRNNTCKECTADQAAANGGTLTNGSLPLSSAATSMRCNHSKGARSSRSAHPAAAG